MLEVQGNHIFFVNFPAICHWLKLQTGGRDRSNGLQASHNDPIQAAMEGSLAIRFCQKWHDSTALTATLTGRKQRHTNRCCWVHPISQRMQESSAFSHLCPDFLQAKKKYKILFQTSLTKSNNHYLHILSPSLYLPIPSGSCPCCCASYPLHPTEIVHPVLFFW